MSIFPLGCSYLLNKTPYGTAIRCFCLTAAENIGINIARDWWTSISQLKVAEAVVNEMNDTKTQLNNSSPKIKCSSDVDNEQHWQMLIKVGLLNVTISPASCPQHGHTLLNQSLDRDVITAQAWSNTITSQLCSQAEHDPHCMNWLRYHLQRGWNESFITNSPWLVSLLNGNMM